MRPYRSQSSVIPNQKAGPGETVQEVSQAPVTSTGWDAAARQVLLSPGKSPAAHRGPAPHIKEPTQLCAHCHPCEPVSLQAVLGLIHNAAHAGDSLPRCWKCQESCCGKDPEQLSWRALCCHTHAASTSEKRPRPPLGALKALTSADCDPSRSWPWSPFVVQKPDKSQRLFKDIKGSFPILGQVLMHLERMTSLYTAPEQVGTLHCLFLCTPASSRRPGTRELLSTCLLHLGPRSCSAPWPAPQQAVMLMTKEKWEGGDEVGS